MLLRFKGIDLLVHGANDDALFVVERGPVDRTGQVVEREFVLTAGVTDGAEAPGRTQGCGHAGHGVLRRNEMNAHNSLLQLFFDFGPDIGQHPRMRFFAGVNAVSLKQLSGVGTVGNAL